jgi:hypothetical protein
VESRLDMRASDVLRQVAEIIDEREEQYGEFHVTSYRTAAIQSIFHEEPRSAESWNLDMVITKLARMYQSPKHFDNYIDAIAYLAEAAALYQTPREEY